jgi:putative mycofactocin binding protein MftB
VSHARGADACSAVEYSVPDWVRVRRESFGLLFYDTRSTRLTFVRSGESLIPPPFTGARRVLRVDVTGAGRRASMSRLLESLIAKGLLVVGEPD